MAMVRERAALHAITVTVEVADDVGMIEADELRFKQVVLNLVSNAVKFTPDGGSVSIRAYREGTELMVTVTDTGIGVAPEDQERIFESFQQGRRGSKEEGTGLGLTLSRRIVGLFGGRMWLEARQASEARSASRSRPAGDGDEVASPEGGGLPVVVLVDDDRASLDLISAYLDGSPTRVLRAWDGVEALDLIRRVLPAAVVLDIKLPRLDGWQVLAELKADPATADYPGGHRLRRRRSAPGPGPRRGGVSPQAGASRRPGRCAATRGCPGHLGVVVTPRRILVVEDNPLNLKLVRDVLQFAGYDVIEAQSGEEGLRVAQEDPPDLVLMDLQLPGIDGTETLRRLRQGSLGRTCRSSLSPPSRWPRTENEHLWPASMDTSRSRSVCVHYPTRSRRSSPSRRTVMDTPVTVLAVDDQPARGSSTRSSPRGHRVLTAPSGAEALACSRPRMSTSSCSTS